LSNNKITLTKVRHETLLKLRDGGVMEIDSMNLASISGESIAPVTRYFLTDKRLVERKDKTKAVTTKGNGYVISVKGAKVLDETGTS
jgi:hypothetical protein